METTRCGLLEIEEIVTLKRNEGSKNKLFQVNSVLSCQEKYTGNNRDILGDIYCSVIHLK